MNPSLLAQVVVEHPAPVRTGYTFGELAIGLVVVLAVVGLVWVACNQFGVVIPVWLQRVVGIVVAAVVVIVAIKIVLSL